VVGEVGATLSLQTPAGQRDAFVIKYGSNGSVIWIRQFGTSERDGAVAVATDPTGNVVVAGATEGVLAGQSASGGSDAFVRKYDPAGTELWTRQFGSAQNEVTGGVAVDSMGNTVVVGLGRGPFPGQTASASAFVRKYTSAGAEVWTQQFLMPGAVFTMATGVAIEPTGNILVSGTMVVASGTFGAFVRKFDASGAEVWTTQFGSNIVSQVYGVAVDPLGNVLVVGIANGSLGLSVGGQDAFVRKYSGSGMEVWTRQFGTANVDRAFAVTSDASGNVFVAGRTDGALTGQANGGGDAFVRKYTSTGTEVWTRQIGSSSADNAYAIAADADGVALIAGDVGGVLPAQPNAGAGDAFLIRLAP
jgi:hypothetical protein